MTDHKWIVGVLKDLETYAASNELSSLLCLIGDARSKVEIEFKVHTTAKDLTERFPSAELLN